MPYAACIMAAAEAAVLTIHAYRLAPMSYVAVIQSQNARALCATIHHSGSNAAATPVRTFGKPGCQTP